MIFISTELISQKDKTKEESNQLVFSYLTLRNLIGFGGMLLPIFLALLPSRPSGYYYNLEPSISDYFYTNRGDILVVMLCIIGTFMITYTGYSWKERLLSSVAGICAMGVAFVPTEKDCLECAQSVHIDGVGVFPTLSGTGWHFLFAAIFLSCTAIMSLVYFTKGGHTRSDIGTLTQKGKRNVSFKVCGWIVIVSLAILGIYFLSGLNLTPFPAAYVFETIAVEAFGFSWLVKGQTLWPDGEHYLSYGFRQLMKLSYGSQLKHEISEHVFDQLKKVNLRDRHPLARFKTLFDCKTFTPEQIPEPANLRALTGIDLLDYNEFKQIKYYDDKTKASFYWMKRLMVAFRKKSLYTGYKIINITFGFHDIVGAQDSKLSNNYRFGVILYVDVKSPPIIARIKSLSPEDLNRLILDTVPVDDFRFPVFLKPVIIEEQCCNPNPSKGTTACKAESQAPGKDVLGFLTARHVSGAIIGAEVLLDCGHIGYVTDVGKDGIDAAFITCPNCNVLKKKPMVACKHVAPWSDAVIHTKSRKIKTKITETTDCLGLYNVSQIPIHLFLADSGVNGDSGALIVELGSGYPVGIYLGAYTNLANRSGGYALHAYQISQVMNLNFFE